MITALSCVLAIGARAPSPQVSLDAEFDASLASASLSTKTAWLDSSLLGLSRSGKNETLFYWHVPSLRDVTRRELSSLSGKPIDSPKVLADSSKPSAKVEDDAANQIARVDVIARIERVKCD